MHVGRSFAVPRCRSDGCQSSTLPQRGAFRARVTPLGLILFWVGHRNCQPPIQWVGYLHGPALRISHWANLAGPILIAFGGTFGDLSNALSRNDVWLQTFAPHVKAQSPPQKIPYVNPDKIPPQCFSCSLRSLLSYSGVSLFCTCDLFVSVPFFSFFSL